MWFIGDVHGHWLTYNWIINKMTLAVPQSYGTYHDAENLPASLQEQVDSVSGAGGTGVDCSSQVGDFGIYRVSEFEKIPVDPNHRFIRGNHDNPAACNEHPGHLGDWGYNEKLEMFWVGGAWSIDSADRTAEVDFWYDEQIKTPELVRAVEKYGDAKPKIMVTHTCPESIKASVANPRYNIISSGNPTEFALEEMLNIHHPDIWIFGHWHKRFEFEVGGCQFVCLNALNYGPVKQGLYEIPGLTW